MKKIIWILLFAFAFIVYDNVYAYSIDFSASATTVYVGDSISTTAYLNSVEGKFSVSSSDGNVLSGGKVTDWVEGGTINAWFTAQNVGTATIVFSSIAATSMDPGNEQDIDVAKYITVNVIARPQVQPIEINRTYSSNNNLLSLGIEGYEIEPAFDKETLEYDLEVDYTVNKINVLAAQEDETATINGIGEYELEEGKNTINVIVTAENGNEKTYVINVLVKELNPIEVKIDKEKYTLVKKADKLPELDNYTKSTIKIDGNDIPALKGSITKYTLVGLKDSKGDIALYIYNAKDKYYTLYNEIKFASISLYYMDNDKSNYKKTTIKIDGKTVTAYKKKGLDYYLIYGMNLKTGKVNWYTYDSKEGTIQMYLEGDKANIIGNNNYLFLVYGLGCICILLVIFNLTLYIKNKKMN